MSERVAITWDDALVAYDFGPQHPLKPIRVKLTVELARAYGLLDLTNVDVVKPRSATRDELELVHTPAYIDAVERISEAATDPYGNYGWGIGIGDNPAFRGMHEASALVAGASLVAAEHVASGAVEHAFNPAGGLHHAMPDRASGFCIYDDPAIAIRRLTGLGERVVYIDVDVHHGDGPQFIFYDDPDVMTISLHESGEYLFPGTGFPEEVGAGPAEGTKVNVALPPLTDHDGYRAAFERIVPAARRVVQADDPRHAARLRHARDRSARAFRARHRHVPLDRVDAPRARAPGDRRPVARGRRRRLPDLHRRPARLDDLYWPRSSAPSSTTGFPRPGASCALEHGAPPELPRTLSDPEVRAPGTRLEQAREEARAAAERTAGTIFGYHGLA